MPARAEIPVGEVFGSWTVVGGSFAGGRTFFDVVCKCGTRASVKPTTLRGGTSRGCRRCGPVRKRSYMLAGVRMSVVELASIAGCRESAMRERLRAAGDGDGGEVTQRVLLPGDGRRRALGGWRARQQ